MVALYGKKYVVPLSVLAVFMCVSLIVCVIFGWIQDTGTSTNHVLK